MREPYISSGYIIFRQGYEAQLMTLGKGHYKAAQEWVQNLGLQKEFEKVSRNPDIKVYEYDEFLTDYIGAIRLYSDNFGKRCYIPRGNNNEYKSYLKNYFISKSGKYSDYYIHGDVAYDEFYTKPSKEFITNYTETVVYNNATGLYMYNPNRIGD